ncbi:MAG: D-sedoheptulose-7-phosphate isomerase [bacterium]
MIEHYASRLGAAISGIEATLHDRRISAEGALDRTIRLFRSAMDAKGKLIFIGNGGSAALASHAAADYGTNGQLRVIAPLDAASLTCISNDLGYECVFETQIARLCEGDDVLVAISSSGESANVLRGADAAHRIGMRVVTLTGFNSANRLRGSGEISFWVPSDDYGIVESAHLALLHVVLDAWRTLTGREDRTVRRDMY